MPRIFALKLEVYKAIMDDPKYGPKLKAARNYDEALAVVLDFAKEKNLPVCNLDEQKQKSRECVTVAA